MDNTSWLLGSFLLPDKLHFWFLRSFTYLTAFKKNYFDPQKPQILPFGLFEHLQLEFIWLPLSMGYQYALGIACMSSGWVESFPCHKVGALTVAKKVLENVFPIWNVPSVISSDQGTHFTGQLVKLTAKFGQSFNIFTVPTILNPQVL